MRSDELMALGLELVPIGPARAQKCRDFGHKNSEGRHDAQPSQNPQKENVMNTNQQNQVQSNKAQSASSSKSNGMEAQVKAFIDNQVNGLSSVQARIAEVDNRITALNGNVGALRDELAKAKASGIHIHVTTRELSIAAAAVTAAAAITIGGVVYYRSRKADGTEVLTPTPVTPAI